MSDLGLVGRQCRVTLEIPKGGEGEVIVDLPDGRGGSQAYPARSPDGSGVPEGRLVWVVEQAGRVLYVGGR